jgi:hypothetical protein
LGERLEEGRNGGLHFKIWTLNLPGANRRFFLPPYEPKQNVIPNPFIGNVLKNWQL